MNGLVCWKEKSAYAINDTHFYQLIEQPQAYL